MIDAIHSALEHSPDALNAVRADAILAVLSGSVVDAIVTKEQTIKADIPRGFVTEDRRANFDVGMNCGLDGKGVRRAHWHSYGTSTALPDAQHGGFADAATASPQFLVLVLIGFLAADVALVCLNNAAQFVNVFIGAARLAQTLQHKPCRLLGNANLFRQLQARDALPSGYEQVHGIEPLVQRNMAALEDRSCADREVKGTGIAAIEANLGLLADAFTALALRAERAIGPEARFQIDPRRLGGREHLEKMEGADRGFTHRLRILLAAQN